MDPRIRSAVPDSDADRRLVRLLRWLDGSDEAGLEIGMPRCLKSAAISLSVEYKDYQDEARCFRHPSCHRLGFLPQG